MNENASLIATLLRALAQPDLQSHLEDFFRRLGSPESDCRAAPDYRECLDVLATVERYFLNRDSHALVVAALKMLVRRIAVAQSAGSQSPWQQEYNALIQSIAQIARRPAAVELIIQSGEQTLARFSLPGGAFEHTIGDIQPGHYRIATDTGWQLWSGDLLASDLVLGPAQPRRHISLAAQDAPVQIQSTRTFDLGETRFQAAVFPGFESGAIRIYRPTNEGAK